MVNSVQIIPLFDQNITFECYKVDIRPGASGYAVISFEDRTIQPLLNAHPWFAAGNYGVDCEFKKNGEIDLLVHYAQNRYE